MVLYSIQGCPNCVRLETKLTAKNIEFEKQMDENVIKAKGFELFPVLETDDGKTFAGFEAITYVNSLGAVNGN